MPELPEVETIRRDLLERIIGKKISAVDVFEKKIIKSDRETFAKNLSGKSFSDIGRAGKLLFFALSDRRNFLLIHLKMTGQLIYVDGKGIIGGGHSLKAGEASMLEKIGGALPNKYTRLAIRFGRSGTLYFNDVRKFGYARIADGEELARIKEGLGIEPLTPVFTLDNFKKALAGKKKSIKARLLDQKFILGLGNIYVDEALFLSGINPKRKTDGLKNVEIKKLHTVIGGLIKKAIKYRGTTFSDYTDASGQKGNFSQFLQVYGRAGQSCPTCGTKILKIKEAGRGTHFCPRCQK